MADAHASGGTGGRRPPAARVARLFASPGAVLVILPALVIAAGVTVLLLGRRATRDTAENMARRQLVAQAEAVRHDVESALDQADPVFKMLRTLAEAAMPTPDALTRLHDILVGRPVTNASIAFPVGVSWGTYKDRATGELGVQESRVGETESTRTNYILEDGVPKPVGTETSDYDPRERPHYQVAVDAKKRVWMEPRVFSSSGKTGVTVSEPVYGDDGQLSAVLTLDYDVAELSDFIQQPPLAGARSVVFTADGTILAYPSAPIPEIATKEKRLLRHSDFKDPALDALFAAIGQRTPSQQRFMHLDAGDGYLASVSAVGGKRAGLDWYLATLVPKSTLFATMKKLGRDSLIASGGALAIAMGVALMFAWNILRMRRAVGAAREQARSAEERARQLGSYRLVEKLGTGGMGEVWRAEHQLLARKAAIKLVRPDVLRDREHAPLIQERFRREAQTLASMRSRHTIELYDYGVTDDGTFFYVMELLDGLDLADLVREHGPQPAARVIRIISQACQSLAEAHDAGLLHRDVKPANIELCRAADEVDIVKVLDFGIVHNIADPIGPVRIATAHAPTDSGERLTSEGAVIGTPGYIPPEQALAEPIGAPSSAPAVRRRIDPRGDLYALGCVAWYLLVGTEVYTRPSEDEVLRAHVFDPIPPLREHVRGWLPIELERLIVQCLAKKPEERPSDARTLARALGGIEIPDEHAWTETEAQLWWSQLKLTRQKAEVETERLLVPQRATTTTSIDNPAISAPDARTVEARPSGRTP